MTEIWHRKQPTFTLYTDKDIVEHRLAWLSEGYKKVATVDVIPEGYTEEDYAYYVTNTIEHRWVDNKGVTPIGRDHRSTSVGDIIKCTDGKVLLCAPLGWEIIG